MLDSAPRLATTLDWKERDGRSGLLRRLGQLLAGRRPASRHFLDPQLAGPRRAVPLAGLTRRETARRALLFIALLCAGIYGTVQAERWWTEIQGRQWLESARSTERDAAPAAAFPVHSSTEASLVIAATPQLAPGDPVGRLSIPRLEVDGMVEHGETESVLRRAIGHLPGTSLPGEGGNVVVAAHRDSFFRGLGSIAQGDVIEFETPDGKHRYTVEATRVVEPDDSSVLAATEGESLTLITCYPFDYVGPAPRRFIVTARPADPTSQLES